MRICETLGEDLQGFVRLWERIHKMQDFGRGFVGEDLQDFGRGFTRIQDFGRGFKDSQDFGRGFMRLWEKICEDS